MSERPNYITPEGYRRLREEYDALFGGERPKLLETIAWAAANGDRSENADYQYGRRRLREAESKTDALASQLDRRISELFSLQELSYVLSESIQLDRIVDQVARYAGRFLQTDGAIVVLADNDRDQRLRVVAATGTLEDLQGRMAEEGDAGLVRFAISRERIEVA